MKEETLLRGPNYHLTRAQLFFFSINQIMASLAEIMALYFQSVELATNIQGDSNSLIPTSTTNVLIELMFYYFGTWYYFLSSHASVKSLLSHYQICSDTRADIILWLNASHLNVTYKHLQTLLSEQLL